jgi:hypothetical protein
LKIVQGCINYTNNILKICKELTNNGLIFFGKHPSDNNEKGTSKNRNNKKEEKKNKVEEKTSRINAAASYSRVDIDIQKMKAIRVTYAY